MKKIILIRHGETGWNAERRSQGWSNNALSTTGLKQAALVGKFARANFKNANVLSSDLTRCIQTADAIGLPYRTSSRLREIDVGRFSGLLADEIEIQYPGVLNTLAYSLDSAPHGGESWENVINRVERFIEKECVFSAERDLIIVSHGGTINCLLIVLLGLPHDHIFKLHVDNTSVSILEHDGSPSTTRLAVYNNVQHLTDSDLA